MLRGEKMGEDSISSIFGSRLRNLRDSRGLRQDDIAALFEMNKSAVSQWENGRLPHPTIIAKLADFFDVSTDFLLGRVDSPRERSDPATIALHRSDNPEDDLPEEALKQIEDYRAYIRQKYKKPD
jgi:transcriptional regulator with XRE-family HTH domain